MQSKMVYMLKHGPVTDIAFYCDYGSLVEIFYHGLVGARPDEPFCIYPLFGKVITFLSYRQGEGPKIMTLVYCVAYVTFLHVCIAIYALISFLICGAKVSLFPELSNDRIVNKLVVCG